jgi:hypothetical protein
VQGYPDDGGAAKAPDANAASEQALQLDRAFIPPTPPAIRDDAERIVPNGASQPRVRAQKRQPNRSVARSAERDDVYGALDLGTNNCRLLLARPSRRGFRVVDAFSRIIRLGEGVSQSGRLSDAAMARTFDALKVCASKLARARVRRSRLVATEACRIAENGEAFLKDVHRRLGLDIEILTPELEARLAVSGSAALIDPASDYVVVFDIGGGSSELIFRGIPAADAGATSQAAWMPRAACWRGPRCPSAW